MDTIIYYSEMEGISLEHLKRSSGFDMRSNHFHNEYEIYFLTEGERLFFFNNRAYQVKKGSLILVDTNLIHMTHAPEDDTTGYTRIILYIDKFKMQQFDEKFPHLNLVPFFREHYGVYNLTQKQQEKFLHMYEVLKAEFSNRSRSYKAMIEMEIIHYFIDFIRDNPKLTPIKDETAIHKSSKYQTIYNIADYISDHYAESISLDGLAGVFYLSKFYLSRSFKEVTGYGVNEYVNILRTKRAKQLLEETTLSVSEIAGTVGYESITYFEKVFKTYMSISPLKYRKTLNGITYKNTITPEAPKQ